jgi:hypothetical protein
LKRAILNAKLKGLRIEHFSLQSNHIHLIAESGSTEEISRGMRSFTVTWAKALGRGQHQPERYHLHSLKTLQETVNALNYVLTNDQHHTGSHGFVEFTSNLTLDSGATTFLLRQAEFLLLQKQKAPAYAGAW